MGGLPENRPANWAVSQGSGWQVRVAGWQLAGGLAGSQAALGRFAEPLDAAVGITMVSPDQGRSIQVIYHGIEGSLSVPPRPAVVHVLDRIDGGGRSVVYDVSIAIERQRTDDRAISCDVDVRHA